MSRLLLLLTTGMGALGILVFGWRSLHQAQLQPVPKAAIAAVAPAPLMVNLLIVSHDLQPGSFLQPGDLAVAAFAPQLAPAGAWNDNPDNRASLLGALVRRRVMHQGVLREPDLLLPGDHGFLAAVLSPGMRAYTVSRDQLVADAGLIWPGDRLDLILTQQMPGSAPPARQMSAETVLRDLKVLAVGRQLAQPQDATTKDHAQADESGTPEVAVTVEVSPIDAERLAVAVRLGKVAFSVRPPVADTADGRPLLPPPPPPPVGSTMWAGNVVHALGQVQPPPATLSVHVINTDSDKEYRF